MKRPSIGFLIVVALVVGSPFLLWAYIQWKSSCEPDIWGRTQTEDGRYSAHVVENDCPDDGQEPDGWVTLVDERTKSTSSPVWIHPVDGTDLEWQGHTLVVIVPPGARMEETKMPSGWPSVSVKTD